ncbi:MAG: hypothetical protein H7Y17_07070, partial [Chlorobia bacterium]|nr:hypothetical protein [Fimbriimonadaceae bacterium]
MPLSTIFIALTLLSVGHQKEKGFTTEQYLKDFDVLWETIRDEYAYFDLHRADWTKARTVFRPKVQEVSHLGEFVMLLERLLDQLADPHTHLNSNTASSQRLVPSGALVWAVPDKEAAVVKSIRSFEVAKGLRTGDRILLINGQTASVAVKQRIGPASNGSDPAVRQYALMCLLAGKRDKAVEIRVARRGATPRDLILIPPDSNKAAKSPTQPLLVKVLPGNVGYIRFNNSLGVQETVLAFDRAIARLSATKGLVIDLRDTPGGGNTTIGRAILGHFVRKERPYQKHSDPGEFRATGIPRSWIELVSPRVPGYTKPVVALVGRWTASMG